MIMSKANSAKELKRLKPVVKNLNFDAIKVRLWDIEEECSNVRWFTNPSIGREVIVNALDGDEDEACEFEMAFSDLDAEVLRMIEDLNEYDNSLVSDFFDKFFGACGCASESFGDGFLGWDPVEEDYVGIEPWNNECIEEFMQSSLSKITKKEIFELSGLCLKIISNYVSLCSRFENLNRAMKILSGENLNILKSVSKINELYELSQRNRFEFPCGKVNEWQQEWIEVVNALPADLWLY